MTAREDAMKRHPSFQSRDRIQVLIDAAQDQQSLDLANRDLVEVELHAGGPMRRANEWHHEWSTRNRWADVLAPVVIVIVLFALVMAAAVLGEYVGGWPA